MGSLEEVISQIGLKYSQKLLKTRHTQISTSNFRINGLILPSTDTLTACLDLRLVELDQDKNAKDGSTKLEHGFFTFY